MPKRKKTFTAQVSQAQSVISIPSAALLGTLAGMALIVVAAIVCYMPVMNGDFIMDDDGLLVKNRLIQASDGLCRLWCTNEAIDYWPATNSLLWIEWRLWGTNTTGYHVGNLILHIAESLLIWIILRKLSIPGAFLAATIFAVHPVNVESVAWISQRKNMMAMLFFLLSIFWYLKEMQGASGHGRRETASDFVQHSSCIPHPSSFYWLSMAAFLLAMLSKGSVVVLPVLLFLIVCWLHPPTMRDALRIAPFFMVAAVLTAVNIWFQTHGGEFDIRSDSFQHRLLGSGVVVWFYLFKALLPINLAFIYPQWRIDGGNPLWWLPLSAVLAVTAALWRWRNTRCRPLFFTWLFFCTALVPVLGFIDVGFMKYSLVADHYQHIAIIGVIALAAASWRAWKRQARATTIRAATLVAIAAAGTLALLAWRQSGVYRDQIALYQATLKNNPGSWMAHNNLGVAIINTAPPEVLIEHFQQALKLKPDYHEAHNNLATILMKTGRLREAIEHYRQAIRLKPDYFEAYNNLGIALFESGSLPEAIENYSQALKFKSDYAEAHYNLGNALLKTKRLQEAIEEYQQALRLMPDNAIVHYVLAMAYAQANRTSEALAMAQKAVELARSQGQTDHVKRIQDWLNAYRAGLTNTPNAPSSPESPPRSP